MADDKKRRVVRGPRDVRPQDRVEQPRLNDYSQVVADSSRSALQDMNDQNYSGQISALQQYPKIKKSDYGKVTIQESPVTGKQPTRSSIDDVYTKNDQVGGGGGGAPEDWRHKRGDEISSLMDKYTKVNEQKSRRQRQIGGQATSIAFSNPAAAAVYERGYKNYIEQPTSSIDDGQKSVVQRQGIDKGQSDQMSTDQDNDPNSDVSRMAREQYKAITGKDAPLTATASAIKKLIPSIKIETDRNTKVYQTDVGADTADKNRQSKQMTDRAHMIMQRELAANKNSSQERIAQLMATAGIDKQVIGKVLGEQFKTSGGGGYGGRGQMHDAQGWTFPNARPDAGGEFLSRDDRMGPPTQQQKKGQQESNDQFTKFHIATRNLNNMIDDVKSGAEQFSIEKWNQLMSMYQQAIAGSVKFNGDGVTNGPDIENAKKAVGDSGSLMQWVTGGNQARLKMAQKQAEQKYTTGAQMRGYKPDTKPNPRSQMIPSGGTGGGPGGGQTGPVFDPQATGNAALGRQGLPPVKPRAPQATVPQTPPIPEPKVNFRMNNGTVIQMSRRGAQIQQSKQLGRIE